jgi:hypothetical protein
MMRDRRGPIVAAPVQLEAGCVRRPGADIVHDPIIDARSQRPQPASVAASSAARRVAICVGSVLGADRAARR